MQETDQLPLTDQPTDQPLTLPLTPLQPTEDTMTPEQLQTIMNQLTLLADKVNVISEAQIKASESQERFDTFMTALEERAAEMDQYEEEEEEDDQEYEEEEEEEQPNVTTFPNASGDQLEKNFKQDLLDTAATDPYAAALKL
jgi:NACalpha-BTF3-like transcription factor